MAIFMDSVYDRLLAATAPDLVAQLAPNFLQEIILEFFESIVDEFQTGGGVSGLAAKSVGELHSLTHLPADPSCPICVQAKITKAPATRKQEGSKDVATSFGDRIHCDLVGPTRASINDEVYAMVTRDEATNYPSVRALRNRSSEETVAAWKDMYGELQIRSVRTDHGGEFDGHFHEHMLVSRIRHERSLPNRPQTNACAERFHRTLAEGMRSLMLMSGVPYVFWHFVLQLLYSCMPVLLQQVVSPHLLNCVSVGLTELSRCILLVLHIISLRSSNLISLSHGAGLELCLVMGACIPMLFLILNITRIANRKFALSTLVMFGFCPNHASHFMSFRCFLLMPLCGLHGWSVMMWTLCLQ